MSLPAISTPLETGETATRVRFRVLAFGCALSALTYLDRVCISITAKPMRADLELTDVQMGFVFSAFTLAYALFEIPTGWWGDRVGARSVLARIVAWWSTFTMATAASFNFTSLVIIRFLFGAGEAGAWPNAARVFSRWFPASERGTAQGIFFMGAHLAGGLTPLLVTAMLAVMPWRFVFLAFGAIGFIWTAAWYWWFRDEPADHSQVNAAELRHIIRGRGSFDGEEQLDWATWKQFLINRNLIALCAMYFTQGYGFYFYITWLPTYLENSRGFKAATLGVLAGLPLLLSVLADLLGGLATDFLSRHFGPRVGRSGLGMAALGAAGLALLAAGRIANPLAAAVLIATAAASANFLLGASWGTCIEIGGKHSGIVSACMNTAGQVGGMLSPVVIPFVVKHTESWDTPLTLAGILYLFGAGCWAFVDPRQKIEALN